MLVETDQLFCQNMNLLRCLGFLSGVAKMCSFCGNLKNAVQCKFLSMVEKLFCPTILVKIVAFRW